MTRAEMDNFREPWDELPPEEPRIVAPPGTIVACAMCHDIEAPQYRLRRVMGRYILLCFKGGQGCWERHPVPMCSFKDEQGVQCGTPAEMRVAFGRDQVVFQDVCALHLGACMTPAHGQATVYPLDGLPSVERV